MTVVIVAIAITTVIVGFTAVWLTRASTNRKLVEAIGGRAQADPVNEHHRLLQLARDEATLATTHGELLRLALDALTSGVIVIDQAGNELVRNRVALALSARSHEQTLIDAAASELLQSALRGAPSDREVETFGPPPRTLFLHAVPITSGANVVGALVVVDDITDQHRIEKTRRDFVANLSHELRTPVGAASLLGEMLVDESDTETRKHLTDRLLVETDRMTDTIDGLLELSRIESTEQRYDEVVDIRQLVDEALERTRVASETGKITVGAVLPSEPLELVGNRDQLLTAVVNLVENAVKYSSAGDSVSVRGRIEKDQLYLVVQDTGPGIPARDLDRVFERFYRVDRSRDTATGGTGIGLSIVRHVALNHGGTVNVSSYEGEGSTFTMILPGGQMSGSADVVAGSMNGEPL